MLKKDLRLKFISELLNGIKVNLHGYFPLSSLLSFLLLLLLLLISGG